MNRGGRRRPERGWSLAALLAIVFLALAVRFWGLGYGLPNPLARPDEEIVVGHSVHVSVGPIADRKAFPHPEILYLVDPVRGRPTPPDAGWAFPYPDLVYGLNGAALAAWRFGGQMVGAYSSSADFVEALATRQAGLQYWICRSVGATCGVLTVLAVYMAALHGYRRRSVALLAALLVAVNFLHARDSHYATVDVPMTLFVTTALAFALKSARTGARADAIWSAAFGGLAASAKFNAAAVFASTTIAAGRRFFGPASARRRRHIVLTLCAAGLVAMAVFAVTSPYCIRYAKAVHFGLRVQRRVLFSTPGPAAWRTILSSTLPVAFGWIGFAAVIGGVARALWKRRVADLVLLVFIVPLFASMAFMTWVLPRYPLPLVPAFAVLAAEAVLAATARLPRWAVAILVVALAAPPLVRIVSYDRVASRPDTRVVAADWIAGNLPAGSRIALCRGYGAPVVNADTKNPPAFERTMVTCSVPEIQAARPSFVVTHTHPSIAFFAPSEEVLPWLAARADKAAEFTPFSGAGVAAGCFSPGDAFYIPFCGFQDMERGGPVIAVWKLRVTE